MKNNRLSLIFSIAALLLAAVAIVAVFSSGGHLCNTNGSELAVGLIAACATLIVGFQIYSKVDYKEQINELAQKIEKAEKIQSENKAMQERIKISESALLANQIIHNADSIYDDMTHYREAAPEYALMKILDAIVPALDAGWKGAAFDVVFNAMDNYIAHVGQSGIIEYCRRNGNDSYPVQKTVFRYELDIRAKSNVIQSHANYHYIKNELEERLSNLEIKLAEAREA